MNHNEQLYTVDEVAKVLGKHTMTIHRRIQQHGKKNSEITIDSELKEGKRYISHTELLRLLKLANLPEAIIHYRLHGKKLKPQPQAS